MVAQPKPTQPSEILRTGDLIPDNRLAPGAEDLLEHDAIARGVAEIASIAKAPVNIALFGAWGSGKSSVYSMIEQHLARIAPGKARIARYDAWKYGGRELKRNFIDSIAHELKLESRPEFSEGLENDQVDAKLNTWPWLRKNWISLLLGVVLAAAVATLWILIQAGATWLFTDAAFGATARGLITQAGTVFGLALIATLVGPKVFEGAVLTKKVPAPEDSDQFAKRFSKLVKTALKGRAKRLIVFIDELDRCDPKDVVATLIDLKTFLDQDNCVFIVAADREVIERALEDLPQAKPVREDEPYYATPGAFLDKIFQHQLALPPLRSRALTKFAHDLVDEQDGIWKELRDHGQDTFDRTVFALVPVHVRSPRRVKVLLNNFATNARIAASRGINWLDRAHEIAVLTVLQTEFPTVADDLRRVPRLLAYLRREETSSSVEAEKVISRYLADASADVGNRENEDPSDDESTETAAGRLLSDDDSPAGHRERKIASTTLRTQLSTYLAKVRAAGVRDPRPDLLYLQAAAGREDLPDPQLGDVIDFATDTAPDTVVAAFDAHESTTLAIAIPLLVIEGDNDTDPGRGFAYESACRLIERLDPGEHQDVAQQVAPSLIAATTAETLSEASLPGAILVARWAGAEDVVRELLQRLRRSTVSAELLGKLTIVLPYLAEDEKSLLVEMIADRFDEHPTPLISALRDAPIELAMDAWAGARDTVVEVLNEVELPDPEPEAEPSRTSASASRRTGQTAQTPKPVPPEPTGSGVIGLDEIVSAVRERPDHELLLSEVLATFQSSSAVKPLRVWVDENAENLVATMSSPVLRARHAFLGLDLYPQGDTATWSTLLPDRPADTASVQSDGTASRGTQNAEGGEDTSADLRMPVSTAADNLLAKLLNAFSTTESGGLRTLGPLVSKVASWTSTSQDAIAATVFVTLQNTGWADGAEADDAGELLWQRKKALFEAASSLAVGDSSPIYDSFAKDLSEVPGGIDLTDSAIDHWIELSLQLPRTAAEHLSNQLDMYEQEEAEQAAILQMRMAVRGIFGGAAPSAADLVAIPELQRSAAITEAWLGLAPSSEDVRNALTTLPFSPESLRRYSGTLDTEQRTSLWSALFPKASTGLLRAVGAGGIAATAIDQVREQVATATREPDRASTVDLLRLAVPADDQIAAVKKSASELATDLLRKGTAGDLRTAAELVLWAGGAGYGHTQALRKEFSELATKHEKALPKKTAQRLRDANLLTVPKKGFLATLLGR